MSARRCHEIAGRVILAAFVLASPRGGFAASEGTDCAQCPLGASGSDSSNTQASQAAAAVRRIQDWKRTTDEFIQGIGRIEQEHHAAKRERARRDDEAEQRRLGRAPAIPAPSVDHAQLEAQRAAKAEEARRMDRAWQTGVAKQREEAQRQEAESRAGRTETARRVMDALRDPFAPGLEPAAPRTGSLVFPEPGALASATSMAATAGGYVTALADLFPDGSAIEWVQAARANLEVTGSAFGKVGQLSEGAKWVDFGSRANDLLDRNPGYDGRAVVAQEFLFDVSESILEHLKPSRALAPTGVFRAFMTELRDYGTHALNAVPQVLDGRMSRAEFEQATDPVFVSERRHPLLTRMARQSPAEFIDATLNDVFRPTGGLCLFRDGC